MAVVDITGEYLSADMDDEAHVVFRGMLEDMMVLADPELYRPFVPYETGNLVLYVWIQKAGCLKSALLLYEKLVRYLEAYGFRINTYDLCMANKMIGGKQLTVCWHVDDLKISCVDANKVTKMIQWMEPEYGEMNGSRGKIHDYLGMWLDYSIPGEVRIYVEEYLMGVLDDFPEDITETPETPVASNLFNVRDDNERDILDDTRAQALKHDVV